MSAPVDPKAEALWAGIRAITDERERVLAAKSLVLKRVSYLGPEGRRTMGELNDVLKRHYAEWKKQRDAEEEA